MVFPLVLGKGKRLFGDTSETKRLELVDSTDLEDGVFILTYRPSAPPRLACPLSVDELRQQPAELVALGRR